MLCVCVCVSVSVCVCARIGNVRKGITERTLIPVVR